MVRRLPVVLVVTLSVAAVPVRAQRTAGGAMDVANAFGRDGSGPWLRESQFAPEVRLVSPAGSLRLNGLVVERGGTFLVPRGALATSVSSPAFGIFRASIADQLEYERSDAAGIGTNELATAISARRGRSGVWLGASRGSLSTDAPDVYGIRAGAWRVLRGAIVSVTSTTERQRAYLPGFATHTVTFVDSVYTDTSGWQHYDRSRTVTDSNRVLRLRRTSDIEARVDWTIWRVSLAGSLARRTMYDSVRTQPTRWGRVDAVVRIAPHLSLVAGGGALPSIDSRTRASRFASLGVRFSPAALLRTPAHPAIRTTATTFAVRPLHDGWYRITFRVPSARTVEISGDFTQWVALSLSETTPDVWEATLALTPGTHRINVRVDGEKWIAPPGVPAMADEFNGTVGIVVVR